MRKNMGKGNKDDNREFLRGLMAGVPAVLAGQVGEGWAAALLMIAFVIVFIRLGR
jgi:hypothetical protein